MAVKSINNDSLQAQDLTRGPSDSIWMGPTGPNWIELHEQPGKGMIFWEDFLDMPDSAGTAGSEINLGQWDTWLSSTNPIIGTAADTTNLPQEGGVLGISGGASTKQVVMAAGIPAYRFISPATGFPFYQKIWFETRIAVGAVTDVTLDMFVGLADTGQAGSSAKITSADSKLISASDTLITTTSGVGGLLGFHKRGHTNPTDVGAVFNVNNGTPQYPGTSSNLQKILTNSGVTALASGLTVMSTTNNIAAANVWQKFGFIYDPTPSCPKMAATAAITTNQTVGTAYSARVTFYLNGQRLPWFLNTADVQSSKFPSSFLTPVIAYRCGTTTTNSLGYVDWMRCAVFANS